MFQLTEDEFKFLMSQTVISKEDNRGGTRKRPYVFTELGVSMLSSVLKSPQAIAVNISIMRAFVALRQHSALYAELKAQVSQLEQKYDEKFDEVFNALDYLMSPPAQRVPIGFGQHPPDA
jgi:ORF6N domain